MEDISEINCIIHKDRKYTNIEILMGLRFKFNMERKWDYGNGLEYF